MINAFSICVFNQVSTSQQVELDVNIKLSIHFNIIELRNRRAQSCPPNVL